MGNGQLGKIWALRLGDWEKMGPEIKGWVNFRLSLRSGKWGSEVREMGKRLSFGNGKWGKLLVMKIVK